MDDFIRSYNGMCLFCPLDFRFQRITLRLVMCHSRIIAFSAVILWAALLGGPAYADGRLWAASSEKIPAEIILRPLLENPDSFKKFGSDYPDGWSVASFKDNTVLVDRGSRPADVDDNFNVAVQNAAGEGTNVVFAHLRKASSGCRGLADPYPFKRSVNGRIWLFLHNGTAPKDVLIRLIGEDYLKAHPPSACSENPPESWIDSELYFLFLLKSMEYSGKRVDEGLKLALTSLHEALGESPDELSFLLTDGKNVWAFRKGPPLFYYFDPVAGLSIAASTPDHEEGWQEVPENTLVSIAPKNPPQLTPFVFEAN